MNVRTLRICTFLLAVAASISVLQVGVAAPISLAPAWSVNQYNQPAPNGVHVTLSGQSASGFTYVGSGTAGLPGTTLPDSRRRPKVYQTFAPFDAAGIGSTLSMTYDIKWGGAVNPINSSQNWRFGFVGTSANSGKGVSLGANLDIGDLAGTAAYEFFVDTSITSGEAGSGTFDTAFTETLNAASDGIARIAQSNADPFNDDVSFNSNAKTLRVKLTLERILDGYNLSFDWTNLGSGNTISHATSINTGDFDPSVAMAAGVTTWDALGFFINADSLGSPAGPWIFTMSNVGVDGVAVPESGSGVFALIAMSLSGWARLRAGQAK